MLDLSQGLAIEERGEFQAAARFYQRLLGETADSAAAATVLVRLGTCLLETDLDEAEDRIALARTRAEEADQPGLLGEVELLEGRLAQSRGSHILALAKLTEAAKNLQTADGTPRADVTIALASAERARGELSHALERLKSIPRSVLDSDLTMSAEYLDELGALYLARGEYTPAVDTLTEALQLDARINKHEYKSGRSRLLLAEAYMGQNRRPRSKRLIQEATEIFEQAETGLSEAYALLGRWYEEGGEYAQATRSYRQGQSIDHESDDDLGEARALRCLAGVARKRGDHDESLEYLDQARSLLAGTEDDIELAALSTEEGLLAVDQSDYERAVACFTDALRRVEEDGEERAIAVAQRMLALALWEKGDLVEAQSLLLSARPVLEERGDLKQLNELLDDLGEVLLERDELGDAIEAGQESLRLDERLDTRSSRAKSLLLLGRVYLRVGDRERAGESLRHADEIYLDSEDDVARSDALFGLGEYYAAEGRLREAINTFRQAILLDSRQNDLVGLARSHRGLAAVYRRRGDLTRAQEHLDDSTNALAAITDPTEKALLAIEAGRLLFDRGQAEEAQRQLEDALRVFTMLGSPVRAATCRRLIAVVLASRAKYSSALENLGEARKVFEEKGARPELDQLFDDLSLVYLQLGRLDDARAAVDQSLQLGSELGWSRGKGRSQLILGQIAIRRNDLETARHHVEEARESYSDAGDDVGLGTSYVLIGDVAVHQRDYESAIRSYKDARRIQQVHADLRGLGQTFRKLGEVYFLRREFQRAEETFEQAEEHLRTITDAREHGQLQLAQGMLAVAMGDHRSAVRGFERALANFKAVEDAENITETYRRLAASYQALQRYDDAMASMRELGLEQAALWKSLLHSMHAEVCAASADKYLAGDYTDAVLAAFALLEQAFAQRTPDIDDRSVSGRIRHWVVPERRGLEPFPNDDALRAFQNYCVSAFGIFRNAAAHRWHEFDSVDAFAAIAAAHMIASLLDRTADDTRLLDIEEDADPAESS